DEEAHRLKDLIDDTVDMGRLDTANIQPQAELANLEDIVREVVGSIRHDFDGRPVEVVSAGRPLPVAVDRRLMKLAIKQLVDNALKYSPPQSPVAVQLSAADSMVNVAITDHGKGIPANEQSRVFERLYRSPAVERQVPGSGLGLSIALNIVRAHHGDLTVASRPGETTFR